MFTQSTLADEIGVSKQTISNLVSKNKASESTMRLLIDYVAHYKDFRQRLAKSHTQEHQDRSQSSNALEHVLKARLERPKDHDSIISSINRDILSAYEAGRLREAFATARVAWPLLVENFPTSPETQRLALTYARAASQIQEHSLALGILSRAKNLPGFDAIPTIRCEVLLSVNALENRLCGIEGLDAFHSYDHILEEIKRLSKREHPERNADWWSIWQHTERARVFVLTDTVSSLVTRDLIDSVSTRFKSCLEYIPSGFNGDGFEIPLARLWSFDDNCVADALDCFSHNRNKAGIIGLRALLDRSEAVTLIRAGQFEEGLYLLKTSQSGLKAMPYKRAMVRGLIKRLELLRSRGFRCFQM